MKKNIVMLLLCALMFCLFGCSAIIEKSIINRTEINQTTEATETQTTEPTTALELSGEEIFELIAPCTVEIYAEGIGSSKFGKGFFINNKGNVITNYHIIEGCYNISVKTQDGRSCEVSKVLGFNKDCDLAVLDTNFANIEPVQLRTEKAKAGEKIFVWGGASTLTSTFLNGEVSAESKEIAGQEYMQISIPVSDGNSGGTVVDENGMLIGIAVAGIETEEGVYLAIPGSKLNDIDMETSYSTYEFFSHTKGDQQLQNLGEFGSLNGLLEETERNPKNFDNPVIISVKGIIVRDTSNRIFLIDCSEETEGYYLLYLIQNKRPIDSLYDAEGIEIVMKDDTSNRVITGDIAIITGTYYHNKLTITGATHSIVGSIIE